MMAGGLDEHPPPASYFCAQASVPGPCARNTPHRPSGVLLFLPPHPPQTHPTLFLFVVTPLHRCPLFGRVGPSKLMAGNSRPSSSSSERARGLFGLARLVDGDRPGAGFAESAADRRPAAASWPQAPRLQKISRILKDCSPSPVRPCGPTRCGRLM